MPLCLAIAKIQLRYGHRHVIRHKRGFTKVPPYSSLTSNAKIPESLLRFKLDISCDFYCEGLTTDILGPS